MKPPMEPPDGLFVQLVDVMSPTKPSGRLVVSYRQLVYIFIYYFHFQKLYSNMLFVLPIIGYNNILILILILSV